MTAATTPPRTYPLGPHRPEVAYHIAEQRAAEHYGAALAWHEARMLALELDAPAVLVAQLDLGYDAANAAAEDMRAAVKLIDAQLYGAGVSP